MKLFNVARWCKTSLEDISTLMAGQLWPMLITDLGTGWSKNFLLGALAVIPLVLLKIPGRWIKFLDIPSILRSVSSSSTFAVSALFSAWRYVAVVFAVVMCPFVCLSVLQAGIVSKWLDKSSWFSAWTLPSTYPTFCYKEISVYRKIRVLFSGTLSKL